MQTDRHPVDCVNWKDAQAYARWLSRQAGGGYRLPSESEWEYAVRAGGSSRYGFGDSVAILCTYGNIADRTSQPQFSPRDFAPCDDGALYTAPVGKYRPNGFGIYDMHGNVKEWTEDRHHPSYAGAPSDGTAWTAGDSIRRVVRGGSCYDGTADVRSASRPWSWWDVRDYGVGFRLAQDQ